MMIRFYFIYLLYFGIHLTTVYSYDDKNIDVSLDRIKRNGQSNTTTISYTSSPSTSSFPTTVLTSLQPRSISITSHTFSTSIATTPTTRVNTTQTTLASSPTSPTTTASTTRTTSTTSVTMTSNTTRTTSVTTATRTSPNTISTYNPDTCYHIGYIKLFNNSCVQKYDAQIFAAGILHSRPTNVTCTVYALSLYISSITNSTTLSNQTNTLSADEIDNIVDSLSNVNLTVNSNTSIITVQDPYRDDNTIVLGASFQRGIGGEIIDTSNKDNITHSIVSTAAIVSEDSLSGVLFLSLMIVDTPTGYANADNITNKILTSSVVIASLRRNSSTYTPMMISLYFKPLEEYKQNGSGKYLCSFYDTNNSNWNESGCTNAYYNREFDRYECNCSHLTSFALMWLPESLSITNGTKTLGTQDIASLVFQSISIICFLIIMVHAISIRIVNPLLRLQTLKLLPLISTASTTILFISYIALGVTAYTQTSSSAETECFLSSKLLMFITYYLLIFMFCVKTSAGYFYYLRFVRLFPQPSYRQLILMLVMSFFISLVCVILALGFNTNSNYNITQLYPYQLCWFTRDVIYYFLTIPTGLFLVLNIIIITLVTRNIISHAFNAATPEQINQRMKRCVLVLLSSCVTQGVGWLFGPFITYVNPVIGNVLGWFFIILNGLEGFWSIVLYLLIRSRRVDQRTQSTAALKFRKPTEIQLFKDKNLDNKDESNTTDVQGTERNMKREWIYSTKDLRKTETDASNDDDDRALN